MANAYESKLAGGGTAPTGDAVASDVLTGKTFSNANEVGVSGTMPNNGAVSGVATPSQPYTIPAGYHNGSGIVTSSAASFIGDNKYLIMSSTVSVNDYTDDTAVSLAMGGSNVFNVSNKSQIVHSQQTSSRAALVGIKGDIVTDLSSQASINNVPTTIDISSYDYIIITSPGAGTATFTIS